MSLAHSARVNNGNVLNCRDPLGPRIGCRASGETGPSSITRDRTHTRPLELPDRPLRDQGGASRRWAGAPRWGPALRALRALRAPHRTPPERRCAVLTPPRSGRQAVGPPSTALRTAGGRRPAGCRVPQPSPTCPTAPQTRAVGARTGIAAGHHPCRWASGHCADPRGCAVAPAGP